MNDVGAIIGVGINADADVLARMDMVVVVDSLAFVLVIEDVDVDGEE
jgi:hypothetical protein